VIKPRVELEAVFLLLIVCGNQRQMIFHDEPE
jgi:hypothetical protein